MYLHICSTIISALKNKVSLSKGTRQKKKSVENSTLGSGKFPKKTVQKKVEKIHVFKMHFKAF